MKKEIMPSVGKLNQHFLIDQEVLDCMVLTPDLTREDVVLEIGPGKGIMTERLADLAGQVIVVEYDSRRIPDLESLSEDKGNIEVIQGNILRMKLPDVDYIVSNIPFNITEPLVKKLFGARVKSSTLLVGQKYGQSIVGEEPSSRLAIITQAYFRTEYLRNVSSSCFSPEPSTDGAIVSLTPISKRDPSCDFKKYMIRCVWDQKTRPLKDALQAGISQYSSIKGGNYTGEEKFLRQLSQTFPHSLDSRVDNLSNPEFMNLYEALSKLKIKKLFGGHKPRGGARNWRSKFAEYLK